MIKRLHSVPTNYIEIVDDGLHTLNTKRAAQLSEVAKSTRVKFTLHAPFADINIASPSKPLLKASIKRLTQSIRHANTINAELLVIHPGSKTGISMFYPQADWKQNVQSLKTLHAIADDYGVKLTIENLPEKYGYLMNSPTSFQRLYNDTNLTTGITLDLGHANLENQIDSFLKETPNQLIHLHASDNLGEFDQHLGVGYGSINWQHIVSVLKQNGFNGIIMTEAVEHVEESVQKLRHLFS
ncbi:MAG: sugar phosphate isomerase/epimerase [Candidatus Bathyarchaeota archaeon]|nr:sugar phosphate isomerase/epimerase [Candidatus Bathyarchaeota archaeon]